MIAVREARPSDAPGIARVHVDSWRTTYRGIMPADFLAGLSYDQRERLWDTWLAQAADSNRAIYVAEDLPVDVAADRVASPAPTASAAPATPAAAPSAAPENRIVGFASGGPASEATRRHAPQFDAELYMIYLLDSHQRRGLGRALLRHVVDRLAAHGHRSLFVWVARDNPSRAFYESLGARLICERRDTLFNQPIDESGYAWDDLNALRTRLHPASTTPPTNR